MKTDYTTVTEITGYKVTKEQLNRMYTRYRFASNLCADKEVLEVACGSGQGLGYLAKKARRVVGGDIDKINLKWAIKNYRGRDNIEIQSLDAHNLPFDDGSFDVVILFEAIYYLSKPEKFIAEANRVLRDKGVLIVCTANKNCPGFNPSPYSFKYFSTTELFKILNHHGFTYIEFFGGCRVKTDTIKEQVISVIKKTAVAFHLIPKTMEGKELLKRIFFGKLIPLPPEIEDGMSEYTSPEYIPHDIPNYDYRVLYSLAFKH
jgi:ubiquinone/menaquinone biosynthesis C-methylase UbiE